MKLAGLAAKRLGAVVFAIIVSGAANPVAPVWLTVSDRDLRVVPGSALDFSQQFGPWPAVVAAATITSDGHFADATGVQRYFCAPLIFTPPWGGLPDHAHADAIAEQLRLAGYNLARLHYMDRALMPEPRQDFDFQPAAAERYRYLVAALGRHGIRWMVDLSSAREGGSAAPFDKADSVPYLQFRSYFDQTQQQNWKRLAREVLEAPDGTHATSLAHDPGLLAITLINESSLDFTAGYQSRHYLGGRWSVYPPAVADAFAAWQQHPVLSPYFGASEPTMQRFTAELEHQTAGWMTDFARAEGFAGPVTQFNNELGLPALAARTAQPLISFHTYYDHPNGFTDPGARQTAGSDIADGLPLVRTLAMEHVHGKPYIVDEYDHPYWSPRRHEVNLAAPAYAAFQGWDGLCRFANPIVLSYDVGDTHAPQRRSAIFPFEVGMDPVAKAGERLAALLYRRGDVAPARSRHTVVLDPATMFHAPRDGFFAGWLDRLALVEGVDVAWQGQPAANPIALDGAIERASEPQTVPIERPADPAWGRLLRRLKSQGLLPPANGTTEDGQTYVSDGGEITLLPESHALRVVTPRTEAVSFEAPGDVHLDRLTIVQPNSPATISVSSLDGAALGRSSHMLAIIATDAINSGAVFSDDRTTLQSLGTLPVRIRSIIATLALHLDGTGTFSVYALGLNGARRERVAATTSGTTLRVPIDFAALRQGPTPYFEIVRNAVANAAD